MTSQEKKRWLQRYRVLDQEINQRLDQIDALRSLAERMTSVVTGMPHGGGSKSREDVYIKLIDLSGEVNQKVDGLVDMQREIESCIVLIGNTKLRDLLLMRYINCKSFGRISADMHYSLRQVYSLHGAALSAIEIPDQMLG